MEYIVAKIKLRDAWRIVWNENPQQNVLSRNPGAFTRANLQFEQELCLR